MSVLVSACNVLLELYLSFCIGHCISDARLDRVLLQKK